MTVYKRAGSDRWQIEFIHGGRAYRKSSGTSDKRTAERIESEWKRSLVAQAHLGEVVPMTLLEATDRYWRSVVAPSQEKNLTVTRRSTAYRLKQLCVEFGPHSHLGAISVVKISEWKDRLLGEGIKPATVDRSLDTLRSLLKRAQREWGALAVVPNISGLKLKVDNKRDRFLSFEEEDRLLAACSQVDASGDLTDLVSLAIETGGRRGELLQVQRKDVHLAGNRLALLHTKTDKPRSVPLTDTARARVLRRLGAEGSASRPLAALFPYDPNTLTRAEGRKGSRGAPRKDAKPGLRAALDAALKLSGVRGLKFHDLRHTFATRLVQKGASLQAVGVLLGHRDPKTTERYAHLQPQLLADAVALLNTRPTAQTLPQGPQAPSSSASVGPQGAGQAEAGTA